MAGSPDRLSHMSAPCKPVQIISLPLIIYPHLLVKPHKRDLIERIGRFPRPILDFETKPLLYDLSDNFGRIKEKSERLRAFEAAWARLQSEEPGYSLNEVDRQFEQELVNWLTNHKAMLFGEMIKETYHYLRDNPHCPERARFEHILVDEYQDLNKAEQKVIDYLANNGSIAVIGDDDQSIYSFKYANPEGIREFPKTHPGCDAIDFDQCRRCPKQVVDMASRLISHNRNRTLGDLHSFEKNQNGNIMIVQWPSLDDEIAGISKRVKKDVMSGEIRPEDVLILAPTRVIGYRIRDALVEQGINAKSYFRESALTSDKLKYSYSILSLLAKPDDLVSWRFLLGYSGISKTADYHTKSYKKLLKYSIENDIPLLDTLNMCLSKRIIIPYTNAIIKQYEIIIQELERIKTEVMNNKEALIGLLTDDTPEDSDFREILIEAIKDAENNKPTDENDCNKWLENVHSFVVEKISFPDDTTAQDHVRIMSLHASKGLSAKYVIVMSMIDDLMPHISGDKNDNRSIEEQRRLFYVAITRCKGSETDYPGTLILSSFTSLPGNEALNMGIQANAYRTRITSVSRFLRDFGETAPVSVSSL